MRFQRIILTVAKIWGFFSLSFLVYILAGHIFGEETIYFSSRKELVAFLFFPLGIIFGLFVAYRSAITGGLITLTSAFFSIVLLPILFRNIYFLGCSLPGLLFLLYGLLKSRSKMVK